ncbi:MAG: hypothetical protein GY845_05865 [Planctomycetes bacterium]|nr:hypothetical protein [Planctomycetota bacterium]
MIYILKKISFFLSILVLLTFVGCIQPSWITYQSEQQGFSVSFPDSPSEFRKTGADKDIGIIHVDFLYLFNRCEQYALAYMDDPEGFTEEKGTKYMLDSAVERAAANIDGVLVNDSAITIMGYHGRDITVEIPYTIDLDNGCSDSYLIRERVILVGDRVYGLVVMTPKDGDTSAAIDKFFNSFTIIPNHKNPTPIYIPTPTPKDELVIFPDPNLDAAVRDVIGKPEGDILQSDLKGYRMFNAEGKNINDLTGLQYWTDLWFLALPQNQITDITELTHMTNLRRLWFEGNQITDVSPLSHLPDLHSANLADNNISDLSPLLASNEFGSLTTFFLWGNPLSEESIDIHIPQLEERGVHIFLKPTYQLND